MILINYIKKVLKIIRYNKFYKIKSETNGMLGYELYRTFYNIAKKNSNANFLEIGGAHGAVSISLALGLKKKQGKGKIIVFEKCEKGSRSKYGDYNQNYQILIENLNKFNVRDNIHLIPKLLDKSTFLEAKKILNGEKIDYLIIDADGLLHRDFSFFYDLVNDGGMIIIDDYDKEKIHKKKKWITTRVVDIFFKHKLIREKMLIKDTIFLYKERGQWNESIYIECEKIIEKAINHFK